MLSVQGEVDLSTSPELLARITNPERESDHVVVDLAEVSFIDSTGLGALVTAEEHLRSKDSELRLVVAAPNVMKVFEITGLTVMFSIYGSLSDALGA